MPKLAVHACVEAAAAASRMTLATVSQGIMSYTLRGSWQEKRAMPAMHTVVMRAAVC